MNRNILRKNAQRKAQALRSAWSMDNTKAELLQHAQSIGLNVDENDNKAEILAAINA